MSIAKITKKDFLGIYGDVFDIDIELASKIIDETKRYYFQDREKECYAKTLEDRWYEKFDYDVYDDEYYFTDIWVCWSEYSKKYIKAIVPYVEGVGSIVDLGCGLSLSTAYLKEIFNDAKVYGYNLKEGRQAIFNEMMKKRCDFEMVYDLKEIMSVDMVFASEYFEHFFRPIEHLNEVLLLKPKYLVIANSFNTNSVGHFHEYMVDDKIVDEKKMSRMFNKYLRSKGYKMKKTKIWNNKPAIWEREGG